MQVKFLPPCSIVQWQCVALVVFCRVNDECDRGTLCVPAPPQLMLCLMLM